MSQSQRPLNRQDFLFKHEAERIAELLLRQYATRVGVEKDSHGYWLNVWWKAGVIAPLTVNETRQALGEDKC